MRSAARLCLVVGLVLACSSTPLPPTASPTQAPPPTQTPAAQITAAPTPTSTPTPTQSPVGPESLGETWTALAFPGFGAEVNDIAVGGPGFVAVGKAPLNIPSQGAVWTSVDGVTWDGPQGPGVFGDTPLYAIESWQGGLILGGADGDRAAFWTSTDGLTWTRLPTRKEFAFCATGCRGDGGQLEAMYVDGDELVVLGSPGCDCEVSPLVEWRSTDGQTWAVQHDLAWDSRPTAQVAVGSGGLRTARDARTGGSQIESSSDGSTWDVVWTSTDRLEDISATSEGFVAVGEDEFSENALAAISSDGLTWSRVSDSRDLRNGSMFAVAASADRLVAIGQHLAQAAVFVSPAITQTLPQLDLAWTATLGNGFVTGPTVADGIVYVGGEQQLYAFPANCAPGSDCLPLWSLRVEPYVTSRPTVADGLVYVTTGSGQVVAFPADCTSMPLDCDPIWHGTAPGNNYISFATIVEDGVVFVTPQNEPIVTFDARCATGGGVCPPMGSIYKLIDEYALQAWPGPAVADGVVYVSTLGLGLYAFPASCATSDAECAPLWVAHVPGYSMTSPTVGDGVVYVADDTGTLYAFAVGCADDGAECRPLWKGHVEGVVQQTGPVVADGVVYIGSASGTLYSFDGACEDDVAYCPPLWTGHTSTGFGYRSAPVVANGFVYAAGKDNVYAFSIDCGSGGSVCTPAAVGAANDQLASDPAVSDGLVFVTAGDGVLYAFREATLP